MQPYNNLFYIYNTGYSITSFQLIRIFLSSITVQSRNLCVLNGNFNLKIELFSWKFNHFAVMLC